MIYTMALMLFPELLGALRLMMFLVNPTTWTDIERYKSEARTRHARGMGGQRVFRSLDLLDLWLLLVRHLFLIANIVTTSSVLVSSSKARSP